MTTVTVMVWVPAVSARPVATQNAPFLKVLEAPAEVGDAVFSHDGRVLVASFTASADPSGKRHVAGRSGLIVWDVPTGRRQQVLSTVGYYQQASFSQDGRTLVSLWSSSHNLQTRLTLWHVDHGKLVHPISHTLDAGEAVAISPDDRLVACGGWRVWGKGEKGGNMIELHDAVTWKLRRKLIGPSVPLDQVVFSPNGALLAASGWAGDAGVGEMSIWHTRTGRALPGRGADIEDSSIVSSSPLFFLDDRTLVCGEVVLNLRYPDKPLRPMLPANTVGDAYSVGPYTRIPGSVAVMRGKDIGRASGLWQGPLEVWDAHRQHRLRAWQGAWEAERPPVLSPDSRWLATDVIGRPNRLALWRLPISK